MAIISYVDAELNPANSTFQDWLTKTNAIITDMGTVVVSIGDNNTGDLTLNGDFTSNNLTTGTANVESLSASTKITAPSLEISNTIIVDSLSVTTSANVATLTVTGNSAMGAMTGASLTLTGNANVSSITANSATFGTTQTDTLSVTANTSLSNLSMTGDLSVTANTSLSNLSMSGDLSVTGNTTIVNLSASGDLSVTANTSLSNLSMSGDLSVTGNTSLADTSVSGKTTFGAGVTEKFIAITSTGNSVTVDCDLGNDFSHLLTENTTFTFSDAPLSGSSFGFVLEIIQDASASGFTVNWPGSVQWAKKTAPILTSTASAVDVFSFKTRDGGTTWQGFVGALDMGVPA